MSLAARVGWLVVGALLVGFTAATGGVLAAVADWSGEHPEAPADGLLPRLLGSAGVAGVLVIAAAAGTIVLVRTAMRPIRDLAALAGQVEAGELTARVQPAGPPEVRVLGTRVNAMLDELQREIAAREASEQTTRQFLADASHELRTPLATIRGYAELFRRGAADRPLDLATAMNRIEAESTRMTGLVEGLLALSRAEEATIDKRPLDLADLAQLAVDDFLVRYPEAHVDTSLEPAPVHGDQAGIEQLLANLLENAARHAPGAPIRVTARPGVLIVDDGGPGVPAADRERVLARFAHAPTGGNGLGLAIVSAIARRHGGAVTISDSDFGGARVHVRLQ